MTEDAHIAAFEQQRGRVTRAHDIDTHAAVVFSQVCGADRAERCCGAFDEFVVEPIDRLQGIVEQLGGGAQGVAGERGEGCGVGAVSGDVADDREPAFADRDGVEEVAADQVLVVLHRPVEAADLPARHGWERVGTQPGLQGAGDPRAFRI